MKYNGPPGLWPFGIESGNGRDLYFSKLNMSWMQEDVKHWGYGHILGWLLSYTIHDYHIVIDGLDIFYPPYPSQLVVDVHQNVKHVFGVCVFCPHFDILWLDIILHSVLSCRGFYFPKLNMSWIQEDAKHWGYGHYLVEQVKNNIDWVDIRAKSKSILT